MLFVWFLGVCGGMAESERFDITEMKGFFVANIMFFCIMKRIDKENDLVKCFYFGGVNYQYCAK